MFRRGMTSLAMAVTLLLAIAVPAAMADTTAGGSSDTYQAYGAWGVGNSNVSVSVTVGTTNGVSVHELDVDSFLVQDITCKGKGNKAGIILTFTIGQSLSAVIKIDNTLGTATASATISGGREEIYNSCTDVDTIRDVTFSASLDLHATTGTTSTKTRTVTTFPDGSKETFTDKNDSRQAAGGMTIGDTSYTPDFGSISHDVSTDVLNPPPHH